MNITFIGNCQTITLCFYFQQLLDQKKFNVSWLLYGDEFKQHLGKWSNKCNNKILDYNDCIDHIKHSDCIIYQEIVLSKSKFCNYKMLQELKKQNCKLIIIPSIHIDYNQYETSLENLKIRENRNKCDIIISDMFETIKNKPLMLTCVHPTTFLFFEIIKKIFIKLGIKFIYDEKINQFLTNDNYMQLPVPYKT